MISSSVTKQKYLDAYYPFGVPDIPEEQNIDHLLHYWVKLGNYPKVEELLANGASPNALDSRKWTPLHTAAALKNSDMYDLLEVYGGEAHIANDTGATAWDYFQLTMSNKKPDFRPPFVDINGKPVSYEDYQKLTKSRYVSDQVVSPEVLIRKWKYRDYEKSKLPFINEIKNRYIKFVDSDRDKFHLTGVTLDDAGKPLGRFPGLGLYATRDYKAGKVIGEYLGKMNLDQSYNAYSYLFDDNAKMDGMAYSNEAARMNDGWPNVSFIPINNCRGSPRRMVMVTIEPIKKGEQFCYNYGIHQVKFDPYQDVRPKAFDDYISKIGDLDEWTRKMGQKVDSLDKISFSEYCEIEKVRYILSTPSICFKLFAKGLLKNQKSFDSLVEEFHASIPENLLAIILGAALLGSNFHQNCMNGEKDALSLISLKGIGALLDVQNGSLHLPFLQIPLIKREGNESIRERRGVLKIGKELTKADIGKRVFRAAPYINDWSYVPLRVTLKDAEWEAITLIDITDTHLIFSKHGQFPMDWNDGNWILLSDFEKYGQPLYIETLKKHGDLSYRNTENWLKSVEKQSYTYKLPTYFVFVPFTKGSISDERVDDQEVQEAKVVLGISPSETNISSIRKKFFALALKHHPDKNPEGTEFFMKIHAAYETIVKAYAKEEFNPATIQNLDELFRLSHERFLGLREKLCYMSDENGLKLWKDFYKKLTSVPLSGEDAELNWVLTHFVKQCRSQYYFLLIQKKLNEIDKQLEAAFQKGSPNETLAVLDDLLFKVKKLDHDYDLENNHSTWDLVKDDLFERSNALIWDHVVAFERARAEICFSLHDVTKALAVKEEVLKYMLNKFKRIREMCEDAVRGCLQQEEKFKSQRPKQELKKEESLEAKEQEEEPVEEEKKGEPTKYRPRPIRFSDLDLGEVHASIKKNLQFFEPPL